MKGIIAIWSGAIVDIPAGWGLCDGSHSTPDLRNKFVIGSDGDHARGAEGGANTHDHTFTTDGHAHTLTSGSPIRLVGASEYSITTETVMVGGTTNSGNNIPPYYALAYIMEL